MAMWLSAMKAGRGQPHIMWPIDMYISTARKTSDATSLRISAGVSRSLRASSAALLSEGALFARCSLAP